MVQIEQGVIPRYYQLKEILEKRIQSGEFQPGDRFPTDDELCQEYGLSRGTVRRAVEMLINAGLLRREQGRGTFINSLQQSHVFFRLASFDEEMKARGWQPSTSLVSRRAFPANAEVAKHLQIPSGEKTIEIIRLRLADGKPVAYETRYLSYKTCPQLLEEDLENQSIHSLLIDKYTIPLVRACYTIEARVLSQKEAEHLQVETGSAGFVIERVTYTTDDKPVTWYRTVYRGDVYRFSAEF
ncbi:HTH-type transcriptional repressor NagR [Anaerolineales bacterium]|nr:HTH-type transcriptional repressor NagR [Anaerolineales bacterium]